MLAPRSSEERDRPTVLHLAQPVEGGVARVVADLVRAQVREGVRAVVACPGGASTGPGEPGAAPGGEPDGGGLARAAAAAGAEVVRWPARRSPGPHVAAETWRAARLVRRIAPDVVHAHSAKAGLAARLALRGSVPTVYQPHAWSFEAVEGRLAALTLGWERYAARWADRVLCVSRAERAAGQRAGVRASWSVVHNGVDLDAFSACHPGEPGYAAERDACRASLPALDGLPAGAPLVVCVGRLCPQKGQSTLLSAWSRIAARAPGARLVLVGDGPDRARLRELAPYGVLLAGATRDARRWYAAADVVVLPSRWEGMALTPLEAMACGRPVVLTDVGGAAECLPPGHAEACLVPPDAPDALAEAVIRLIREPGLRAFLGEVARKHVRARFDVRRTAGQVLDLYAEVLAHRTPPVPEAAAGDAAAADPCADPGSGAEPDGGARGNADGSAAGDAHGVREAAGLSGAAGR